MKTIYLSSLFSTTKIIMNKVKTIYLSSLFSTTKVIINKVTKFSTTNHEQGEDHL